MQGNDKVDMRQYLFCNRLFRKKIDKTSMKPIRAEPYKKLEKVLFLFKLNAGCLYLLRLRGAIAFRSRKAAISMVGKIAWT